LRTDVELLRILAAFGIVWFHSGIDYGREFSYTGLVIFIILSSYFATITTKKYFIRDRFSRLIAPYVIWAAVYGVLKIISGKQVFNDEYSTIGNILVSPSLHLWYLPFIFISLIILDFTYRNLRKSKIRIPSIVMMLSVLFSSSIWRDVNFGVPGNQYIHALPAIFIGVVLGVTSKEEFNKKLKISIFLITVSFSLILLDVKGVSVQYSAAIILSLILLKEKSIISSNKYILIISKATFGIYLTHIIFLFIAKKIFTNEIGVVLIAFSLSLLSTLALLKFTPYRFRKYIA